MKKLLHVSYFVLILFLGNSCHKEKNEGLPDNQITEKAFDISDAEYDPETEKWLVSSIDPYTPFYVDLLDDSNQRKAYWVIDDSRFSYLNYPNDNISGVPVSVVQALCFEYQNLGSSADQIKRRYLGTYFTQTQWNQFIEVFNARYGWGL